MLRHKHAQREGHKRNTKTESIRPYRQLFSIEAGACTAVDFPSSSLKCPLAIHSHRNENALRVMETLTEVKAKYGLVKCDIILQSSNNVHCISVNKATRPGDGDLTS